MAQRKLLSQPASENGDPQFFDAVLADQKIGAGESTTLILRPRTGLAAGSYQESFMVADETSGKKIEITASLTVEAVNHSLSALPNWILRQQKKDTDRLRPSRLL